MISVWTQAGPALLITDILSNLVHSASRLGIVLHTSNPLGVQVAKANDSQPAELEREVVKESTASVAANRVRYNK